MTLPQLLVLSILGVALLAFIWDRVRVDVVAMLVLLTLVLTGLVPASDAFLAFSNPAVITVGAVFILSAGLTITGVADRIALQMLRWGGDHPIRLLVVIMAVGTLLSSLMNDIGAAAILLPAVVGIARQSKMPPSRLLLPLAWSTLLGGTLTLIGTPPNLLASELLVSAGLPGFSFFDFTEMGLIMALTGVLYMWLVGRHLLPDRPTTEDLSESEDARGYRWELRISSRSRLVGRRLNDTLLGRVYDLNVLNVRRADGTAWQLTDRLAAHDVLIVEGTPKNVFGACQNYDLVRLATGGEPAHSTSMTMAEVILAPQSRLERRTLRDIDLRAQYGVSVTAVRRAGKAIVVGLGSLPLEIGDALLVEGPPDSLRQLRQSADFIVLDLPTPALRRQSRAPLAVAIMLGVLVLVASGLLHVSVAMLSGALLMVLSGVLTMDEAYQAINWKAVFLIVGMLPMGAALEQTGAAELIAEQIIRLFGGFGPLAVMLGLTTATIILTAIISNAAATVLMVPIAIDAAQRLGVSPHAFVMAAAIAASMAFLSPVGHQVNVLVFGPGGYRFSDYPRVGLGLSVLILIMVVVFLPVFWPF